MVEATSTVLVHAPQLQKAPQRVTLFLGSMTSATGGIDVYFSYHIVLHRKALLITQHTHTRTSTHTILHPQTNLFLQ